MTNLILQVNAIRPLFQTNTNNIPPKSIENIRATIDKIDIATNNLRAEWERLRIFDNCPRFPFFLNRKE